MKPTPLAKLIACLFCLLLPAHSSAIVVSANSLTSDVLADPSDYPEVVALLGGRAVGTLIDESWILTAAHVGQFIDQNAEGEELTIGGERNGIAEVVFHPDWDAEAVGAPGVVDMALLRVTYPVSGVIPVLLYEDQGELNAVVTLLGWGRTGDGESEVLVRDGRFRKGENRVDAVTPRLRFRFDETDSARALPMEAVSGPGDSGGPAFLEVDGKRHLAGVSSYQEDVTVPGVFGVTENYERVSDHIAWIESVIAR